MLIVALIKKQQVPGPGHGAFSAKPAAVLLDQRQRGDESLLVAIQRRPAVEQRRLFRAQFDFRRQTSCEAVDPAPARIVWTQGFGHRKTRKTGAVTVKPAWRWTATSTQITVFIGPSRGLWE